MSKAVYQVSEGWGDAGEVYGVFVAADALVEKLRGRIIYLGDIFGRCSDVEIEFNPERLTDDPGSVAFVLEYGPLGHYVFNIDAMGEQVWADACDEYEPLADGPGDDYDERYAFATAARALFLVECGELG